MKANKLKSTAIITLITLAVNYIWGRILSQPSILSTLSRLDIKVFHISPYIGPSYLLLSFLGLLLAIKLGIFVAERASKTKFNGKAKTGIVLVSAIVSILLTAASNLFYMRYGFAFTNKTGLSVAATSGIISTLRVLVLVLSCLIFLPRGASTEKTASSAVKTKKEEMADENKRATVNIYIFIGLFAVCYVVTSRFFVSLGLSCLAMVVFLVLKSVFTKGKTAETAAVKKAMAYYEACEKAGLNEFTSEKSIARAEAIAKANNFGEVSDYAALYEEGRKYSAELQAKVASEEKQERIAKLSEEESKKSAELNKYASRTGNDKTIAMLNEELSALISRKNALANFGSTSTKMLTQKEKDWAVAGGIASGIAGGAAGVATALDVQAQNAQIRAHNEQVMSNAAAAQMYINSSGVLDQLASEIADKQQELEKEKIKLVGKIAPEELVKHLSFSDTKAYISEAGSVYVDTTVSMPDPIVIFDDVNARIDGTVSAVVSKDGREIARVALVLPKYGLSANESCEAHGITLAKVAEEEDLSVTFTATNLYAIEK